MRWWYWRASQQNGDQAASFGWRHMTSRRGNASGPAASSEHLFYPFREDHGHCTAAPNEMTSCAARYRDTWPWAGGDHHAFFIAPFLARWSNTAQLGDHRGLRAGPGRRSNHRSPSPNPSPVPSENADGHQPLACGCVPYTWSPGHRTNPHCASRSICPGR
jgi:hypothetical protein